MTISEKVQTSDTQYIFGTEICIIFADQQTEDKKGSDNVITFFPL